MNQNTRLPHDGAPTDGEEDDDLPVGRVLGRREVLGLCGLAGLAFPTACGAPAAAPAVSAATATTTATTASAATPTSTPASTTATSIIASPPTTSAATTATASATTSVVATATTAATGCVVRPELTVGPYFVDEKLARADIRSAPTTGHPGRHRAGLRRHLRPRPRPHRCGGRRGGHQHRRRRIGRRGWWAAAIAPGDGATTRKGALSWIGGATTVPIAPPILAALLHSDPRSGGR